MILAKNVIASAANARRVAFVALEEMLGVARLGLSAGKSIRALPCGTDMKDDDNDKRYRLPACEARLNVEQYFPRSHRNSDGSCHVVEHCLHN